MKPLHATLPGLLCAVQTADSGSFTAAAQVLDLTPAAVSKNVATLEAQLGVRLFNRTTRQLSLTDEGRRFVAQARDGLHLLEAARAAATQQQAPEGRVRMSCAVGFGRRFVLPLLPDFFQRYPQVQLELSLSDVKVDLVRDGFDVGLRGGAAPPEGMVARKLCVVPGVLVASPGYLKAHGTPASWRDLAQHRLVGVKFLSGRVALWQFREGRQTFSFEPAGRLMLSDPEIVLNAILAGLGIAQMAQHHAWDALTDGRLQRVLVQQHRSGGLEMSLFYPHRQGLAPRVRALVDYLLEHLPSQPALRGQAATGQRAARQPR